MVSVPAAIDKLVHAVAAQPHIDRIWLFGSRARGEARERSDVDLAVEAPQASRREWLEVCRLIEEADTLLPIDLVRIEEAPADLQAQIKAEGRILYER